jgi:hypothetical protein
MNNLMNELLEMLLDEIITDAINNGDTDTLAAVEAEYGDFIGEENCEFLQALIAV